MKKNRTLKLLVLGSVVAVPMVAVAENKIAIQMQKYQENDDRIEVQDGKLSLDHAFGTNHLVNLEYDWDTISGASPSWDSLTGASQTVTSDTVTGASPCIDEDGGYYELCRDTREIPGIVGDGFIGFDGLAYKNTGLTDRRDAGSMLYTYRTPKKRNEISMGASYSEESDFINTGASAEYLMYLDKGKNRSMTIGASFMKNEVFDYLEDHWNTFDLINTQIGISQVFNSHSVGKASIYFMNEDGHLSNPYFNVVRRINVTAEATDPAYFKFYLSRDSRPDKRQAGGLATQYVNIVGNGTALHVSYRYYQDSWAVRSHTLEGKSFHDVGSKFRIGPVLRFYDQSAASFFKAHDAVDSVFDESGFATADHRLGDYTSWTAQLGIEYKQTKELIWNITSGYQNQSSGLEFGWVNAGISFQY